MRDILKEQRKNRKMTQAEIANKAGISRSEYTNIEIGIREPSFALALKLKEILGYRDDDLFMKCGAADEKKRNSVNVGEKICAARKAQHMTQKELGKKLGISQQAVNQFENGKSGINLKTLENIAFALNLSANDIIEGEISMAEKKSALTAVTVKSAQENIINLYSNTAGTILQALNRRETVELFNAEAILVGEEDAVTEDNVIKLFGEEAAKFVEKPEKIGIHYNVYGNGHEDLTYFTFKGLEMAVTFSNIEKVSKAKDKA